MSEIRFITVGRTSLKDGAWESSLGEIPVMEYVSGGIGTFGLTRV